MNTAPESTNTNSVAKFKGIASLRRKLLIYIFPLVLSPLVIASTIGYNLIQSSAKSEMIKELKNDLKTDTTLASKIVMVFIRDSFQVIDSIASDSDVIQSLEAGTRKSQRERLTQQPIEQLERNFNSTKLLTTDNSLNNYLQNLVNSTQIIDIFYTERNGFNLAFTKPPSDFVQRDEDWWQITRQKGRLIEQLELDEVGNHDVFVLSQAVTDPQTQEFLGVIRASIPIKTLNYNLSIYLDGEYKEYQYYKFKIIDPNKNSVLSNIDPQFYEAESPEPPATKIREITAFGAEIINFAKIMIEVTENALSLEAAKQSIEQQLEFTEFKLHQEEIFTETITVASLRIENKIYSLANIPNTSLVSVGIVDYKMFPPTTDNKLVTVFALTAVVLGVISLGLILLVARQITKPLSDLSSTAQEVAKGNLDLQASLAGTRETQTLADNLNYLIKQVKESLQKQQALAEEQREQKEQLEKAIYILIDEVADATEGDLTVRANLESLELSTVADLFNAIIDSLKDIAIETKQSTSQVGSSLKQNELAISFLSDQAIAQSEEIRETLVSIEQMSQSIQEVAKNTSEAETIVNDTYQTVLNSSHNMDLTVDSILDLRNTVGETAKKMKRLGESSQKISQVVSFIEEIALKTNVLAINASVEARRAGEYGQGFTIVAEQVGTLAEQSAAATQKIASIVGKIQAETQEVSQAMESGTAVVINSTQRVESTKESLTLVLEKTQEINKLMSSISQATISQANTSQNITKLMEKIAQMSEATSISSKQVVQSIIETAEIANKLESAVAKFKVAEEL